MHPEFVIELLKIAARMAEISFKPLTECVETVLEQALFITRSGALDPQNGSIHRNATASAQ